MFSSFPAQRGSLLLLHGLPPLRTHHLLMGNQDPKVSAFIADWILSLAFLGLYQLLPGNLPAPIWRPMVKMALSSHPLPRGLNSVTLFWVTFPCNWKFARKTARIWGAACDKILTFVSLELLPLTLASVWSNGGLGSDSTITKESPGGRNLVTLGMGMEYRKQLSGPLREGSS